MTGTRPRKHGRTAAAALEHSRADEIAGAETVSSTARPNAPISIRLSAPLLERLDRLAQAEHRKRSNLIQHVLWEYVHARERGTKRV